jgi:ribonuclease J
MVKQETTLTFYGGVNEIGGNKILLQDRETKVFLDFGMSFAARRQYYSPPFLSPKNEKSLQDLGILPRLNGVYKFDQSPVQLSALFLSHCHLDHSAYLSLVNRKIPVYCGETTQTILQTLGETRRSDWEFNLEDLDFHTFRTGDKLAVDNVEVHPIHVDHSVPGAYGFIIYTSSGVVVYTGDFRNHGTKMEMTEEFIQKAAREKPLAVITEATNMTEASVSSEKEVESKLDSIAKQADGIVLAEFAHTDVDRLNSFYQIAKNNGRCLAISLRQAFLLEKLREDKGLKIPHINDERILIFRRLKKTSEKWEKQIMERYPSKIINVFDASKQQCKLILAMSFYDLEELVELRPEAGSCYVSSTSEPFNEEMELDYEKLVSWLNRYGLPHYHVHVSGHIMPFHLKNTLKMINPKRIFPVHTENAFLFKRFVQDLKGETTIVERDKKYKL